jgi:hypothetical protein
LEDPQQPFPLTQFIKHLHAVVRPMTASYGRNIGTIPRVGKETALHLSFRTPRGLVWCADWRGLAFAVWLDREIVVRVKVRF